MNQNALVKAALFMLVLVVGALLAWELYLRNLGIPVSYDDNPAMWSSKRSMAYQPADRSTVFIGSSRIKFDLDTDTWVNITGDQPIMLACVGSSPRPLLDDLANDKNFKGRLVVDVTEGLFFSYAPPNLSTPLDNLKYHKDRTPAQRASFQINSFLESNLVFLDKEDLSMNAILEKLPIPSRKGVFIAPDFPMDFGKVHFSRQEFMTDKFAADTNMQKEVIGIWNFLRSLSKNPPASGGLLDTMMMEVKTSVDKIRARGGQVIFVRTPSSGPMLMGEGMGFPREKYWERILKYTNSDGIHFKDYPATASMICPELSHLTVPDAIRYTKELIRILHEEKGWSFPKMAATVK